MKGENLLAAVEFTPVQLYSTGQAMKELFWLETDPKWFNLATQLQVINSPSSSTLQASLDNLMEYHLFIVGEFTRPLFSISQDVQLQQCLNDTYCLPEKPKVAFGLRGSSADIIVDNAAYSEFLFNTFNISTVDEESAAVVMVSQKKTIHVKVQKQLSTLKYYKFKTFRKVIDLIMVSGSGPILKT